MVDFAALAFVFLAGLVTAIATGLGALPFFLYDDVSDEWNVALWGVASGIMLSASLFGLVNEGLAESTAAGVPWLLVLGLLSGVALVVVANRVLEGVDVGGTDDEHAPEDAHAGHGDEQRATDGSGNPIPDPPESDVDHHHDHDGQDQTGQHDDDHDHDGHDQTGQHHDDHDQTGQHHDDHDQTGQHHDDHDQTGHDQTGHDQTGQHHDDHDQTGHDQTGHDQTGQHHDDHDGHDGHDHGVDPAAFAEADLKKLVLILGVLTVHSFPEGVAVGVSFAELGLEGGVAMFGLTVPVLAIFMTIAISIHNVPEGLAISIPLRAMDVSEWRMVGAAIFSSLPQPIGAVIAFAFVRWAREFLPFGFGFAAGAMVYLVLSEFVPEALEAGADLENGGKPQLAIGLGAGFAVMIPLLFVG